jgi:hypothetical protein
MQWSDIQFNPSDKTLRQFAGLCLIVFSLAALVQLQFRHHPVAALVYGVLAVVLGPLGLIAPRAVRPVWVTWMVIAFPIGWLVSTVVLAILFYGIFTPIGLAFRMSGRDALALKRAPRQSYWTPRPEPRSARQYFRQS